MSEENKVLARDSWEKTVNQRDLDAVEEIYAPDFVWHEPDQDIRGYEQARQFAFFLGVYVLLPAFNESPANSARLTGRCPLTSKPERPHRCDYDNSAAQVSTFAPTASKQAGFREELF